MKLSAADAIIPSTKLRDYLLSMTHPDGRAKAAYLRRLGYALADWPRLEADLRAQVLTRDAQPSEETVYGQKYEIMGPLTGPNGITGVVLTIWIVRIGEQAARLVTLVPQGRL